MKTTSKTMRKVLILSYHSLPMEVIASYRAQGYLKYLYGRGLFPTLVTHRWEHASNGSWMHHKDNAETILETHSTHRIIRLPRRRSLKTRVLNFIYTSRVLKYGYILFSWLYGHLDMLPEQWDSYWMYKRYLRRHLRTEKYDLILAIFSPHHHLRLAYQLHREFGIPYVLDFRDLWDTRIMQSNYNPTPKERLHDLCCRYYWRRWLRHASLYAITSNEWRDKLGEITQTPGLTILNGYEEDLFQGYCVRDHSCFTVLHAGTLYRHQHLSLFIEGVKHFISAHHPDNFKVLLLGAQKKVGYSTRTSPLTDEALVRLIQPIHPCTELLPRTSKARAVECIREAQILFLPSFPRHSGTYSTKIFDYLAAQKPILAVPEDKGVIDRILRETNMGFVANTPEAISEYIAQHYYEWKNNSSLVKKTPNPPSTQVMHYRRQTQVQRMAEALHLVIQKQTHRAHSTSRQLVSI